MDNISLQIDQVDRFVGVYEWREQCEPWGGAVRIIAAESDTAAFYGVEFNPPLCRRASGRLGARFAGNSKNSSQDA